MAKLRALILLRIEGSLPGPPPAVEWKHYRHCHIEPDWLLIYKIDGDDLHPVRIGTHSDLF